MSGSLGSLAHTLYVPRVQQAASGATEGGDGDQVGSPRPLYSEHLSVRLFSTGLLCEVF